MKFSTIIASAATLVAAIQAADVTVSYMTLEYPGLTKTIPVGLDTSSTMTVDGWTVSGTATIVNDVAVIVDATAVYMRELSPSGGGAVQGGNGPQNTNAVGGVTVIGGTIQGLSAATATDSSSQASATSSSPSSSSTGDSGASRFGGGQALAMAGFGAAVVAAVV